MNYTQFPRRPYLNGPTPIEAMTSLSSVLGGKVNLYVKRDDLLPGAAGGNKTRKLEFCIADAMEKGADTIITCGAVQSNHCRLTAAWSAKEGLDCHLVLEERVEGSYKKDASGNNFLFELLDVKSIRVVDGGMQAWRQKQLLTAVEANRPHPASVTKDRSEERVQRGGG